MIQLSSDKIIALLPMSECIGVMEELYKKEASNVENQPMRTLTRIDDNSIILTMPAYSPTLRRFAVKIVSEYKENQRRYSLPVQGGIIALIDGANAEVLALLDSSSITAIRTGAIGGLAARLFSKENAKKVGVIGSGRQARTQLEAVCAVREIREAKVYSPIERNAKLYAKETADNLGIAVQEVKSSKQAIEDADVIILATNSAVPVISWTDVPPGCHINSIGALPYRTEADEETICNSILYADYKRGVLSEAGDVMSAIRSGRISEKHIRGDLFEVLANPELGMKEKEEVSFFKSVGFALQDVYASNYVYEKAAAKSS